MMMYIININNLNLEEETCSSWDHVTNLWPPIRGEIGRRLGGDWIKLKPTKKIKPIRVLVFLYYAGVGLESDWNLLWDAQSGSLYIDSI